MDGEFIEPASDQESGRRQDSRVGVIVLSSSLRVLYISRAAIELLKLTTLGTDLREPASSSGGLPQGVTNIARTIVEELGRRVASRNWAPFEVRRHLDEWQEPMWLRGLGLPNPSGLPRSRIVLTLSRNPFSP